MRRMMAMVMAIGTLPWLLACSEAATVDPAPSPDSPNPAAPATPTTIDDRPSVPARASGNGRPNPGPARGASAEPLPGPEMDLLFAVPAVIRASSVLRDDAQYLRHLVDDDPATAWNSQRGDLAGAYLEVDLPADVQLTAIVLSAGHLGRTRHDLFTANQRIKQVAVSRDGVPVGTFDLDLERRDLQRLPLRGPGGTYRIEFRSFEPGSRPTWREACVAELRMVGRAPGATPRRFQPELRIGLDSEDALRAALRRQRLEERDLRAAVSADEPGGAVDGAGEGSPEARRERIAWSVRPHQAHTYMGLLIRVCGGDSLPVEYNEIYHDFRIAHARADRLRRHLTDDPAPTNHLAARAARAEARELQEWERYAEHLERAASRACEAAGADLDLRRRPWRFHRAGTDAPVVPR